VDIALTGRLYDVNSTGLILESKFSWPIYDSSNNVNYVVSYYINIYRKAGQDIVGKTEFVTVKTV
jgi:hypothetical protein